VSKVAQDDVPRQIVLRCSFDLAMRLGAIWPATLPHRVALGKSRVHIAIIDRHLGWPLFWRIVDDPTPRSV
jgi:hypothetical protein